ncbi:MAG: hypothetical protein LOD91_03290 [Limnochordales bacterium]|nr:hypothetical protein [Limnochordales bacterium]
MPKEPVGKGQVIHYKSSDGRVVAMFVSGQFDDYTSFPPFAEDEREIAHLQTAYKLKDPKRERETKAHLTPDDWPLQIVVLNRDKGSFVNPHYHRNDGLPETPTRHQIMICQRGLARIGVYTKEGEYIDTVDLKEDDLILLFEGHSIEFVGEDTKLIEIKMGPFPETDEQDKVDIQVEA